VDYREALKAIYTPKSGSIWRAPNKIWSSGFAQNESANPESIHPLVVEKLLPDDVTTIVIPGTSKDYQRGSCVYKVELGGSGIITHFLILLSMPYPANDLMDLERGWHGDDEFAETQQSHFVRQLKFCRGE
jgi:hypothetical protein